jgi:hypothetical protein
MDKQSTIFPRFLIAVGSTAAFYFFLCLFEDAAFVDYVLLMGIALVVAAIGAYELSETNEFNASFFESE